LAEYLRPEIMRGMALGPGFKVPDLRAMSYGEVHEYIVSSLPREGPPMFGLHPNAEIGYLTTFADDLLKTIVSLSGGGGGSSKAAAGTGVRATLNDLLERLPENFSAIDLEMRAAPLLTQKTAPFVLVALQECTRMNELLDEVCYTTLLMAPILLTTSISQVRRSLVELRKGLDGQLNMSEPMEDLAAALAINQVPGRNVRSLQQ
jgi:dynein heavy chain